MVQHPERERRESRGGEERMWRHPTFSPHNSEFGYMCVSVLCGSCRAVALWSRASITSGYLPCGLVALG